MYDFAIIGGGIVGLATAYRLGVMERIVPEVKAKKAANARLAP